MSDPFIKRLLEACKDYRKQLNKTLRVLRDVSDNYDDTGCDRCGVISARVKQRVDKVLKEVV
jgi:hypothetical protein